MEEDTGKSLHVGGATGRIHGAEYSLVDYNRAGIPLIEIVTKPITGTGRARPRSPVRTSRPCATCSGPRRLDVRMEQGSLRCDANVSLRPSPQAARHPHRDQERQLAAQRRAGRALRDQPAGGSAQRGGRIVQETRHWHEDTGVTTSGRSKEQAEDYRYFPEPDLVPIAPDRDLVEALRGTLPEPPARSAGGCRPTGASPTSRCATSSTRVPSSSSARPSQPVPPRRPRASGGRRSWRGAPTPRAWSWRRWP
jgi:aspartyl-tRNA(Asn)/glutamyl-tRNA(Gln) amidotransferase subunit B